MGNLVCKGVGRKGGAGRLTKMNKVHEGRAGRWGYPTCWEKCPEGVVVNARGQQAELLERRGKVAERLEQLG